MIIIFPVLMDDNISNVVLPGVCKSLEKFLLIYEMDAISKILGEKIIRIAGTASSVMAIARKMPKITEESFFLVEDKKDEPAKEKEASEKYEKAKDSMKNFVDVSKGIKDLGTIRFDVSDSNSLSLEPTYAVVTTMTGTKIIGIKVIPVVVKNSKGLSLAEMMVSDLSLTYWNSLLTKYKRKMIRGFWAVSRAIRIPFLKGKANKVITGDPEKDILLASTFHRNYVFCLLNFADITTSDFFRNAGGIHKLHSLGWNSIIAADDVNKRMFWCMKEFHGLCSTTPYSYIFSSLGNDQSRAYTDLETVKKTASSIFAKPSTSISKLFEQENTPLKNYLKRLN